MRQAFGIGLAAILLDFAVLASSGRAQQTDPFAPYGSRSRGYSGNGQYRRASSEPPTRQVEPTRAVPAERPHDYFPGMRSGQAPNSNYIPPHHLCVPGRRTFLYR